MREPTPRQEQVLRLIAAGHTNQEIADTLGLTLAGAQSCIYALYARINVRNRADATRWYLERQHAEGAAA